ncbi:MAG: inorganic diphosphatase [Chloroflexi bacterium]|nr:inorganic diphosphatase [Chloroflexota bacterium]
MKGRSQVSRRRQGRGSTPEPGEITVQVIVEEPAGSHNLYTYDQRRQAFRLSGVNLQAEAARPFEVGRVANTLGVDGAALKAVVLVTAPTFPGCLVEARVVGAMASAVEDGTQLCLVGVPTVDPSWDAPPEVAGLPAELRHLLEHSVPGFGRWLSGEEVAPLVREAAEAYWRAKAKAESAVRAGAAWKATGPPAAAAGQQGEAEPHTWAEYLIPSLPLRFQRYVEELLLPDERILFFVERPEFVPPGALAALRRHKLRRGLLVITDRQVMTMLDSLPPGATMVAWGYVAKATAVERLESVWLEQRNSAVEFGIAIASAKGVERYALLFPRQYEEVLEEGAALLGHFLSAGSVSVRRLYTEETAVAGQDDEGREELMARYPHLAEGVSRAGGQVVAAAAARGSQGKGLGPALVVTDQSVLVFGGSRSAGIRVEWQEFTVANISSLEMVRSLLGCRLELFLPEEEELDKVTLKFDYPDSPAFARAFVTLRHLLGRPI